MSKLIFSPSLSSLSLFFSSILTPKEVQMINQHISPGAPLALLAPLGIQTLALPDVCRRLQAFHGDRRGLGGRTSPEPLWASTASAKLPFLGCTPHTPVLCLSLAAGAQDSDGSCCSRGLRVAIPRPQGPGHEEQLGRHGPAVCCLSPFLCLPGTCCLTFLRADPVSSHHRPGWPRPCQPRLREPPGLGWGNTSAHASTASTCTQ